MPAIHGRLEKSMRVFVGFGYNARDHWIETQVFPILKSLGFTVVDGKGLHGQELQEGVKSRIDQSDAIIGFFTIRDGQGDADFNSHLWVRDETVYAAAKSKLILPVLEQGVRVPRGLLGDRQHIPLRPDDRLACVVELVEALDQHQIRRLKLVPGDDVLGRKLHQWRRAPSFRIRYRTRDDQGIESPHRDGRLELVEQGFYLNVADLSHRALVEVEGLLGDEVQFSSGWVSADAIQVEIL
jgi:hypothetical protein